MTEQLAALHNWFAVGYTWSVHASGLFWSTQGAYNQLLGLPRPFQMHSDSPSKVLMWLHGWVVMHDYYNIFSPTWLDILILLAVNTRQVLLYNFCGLQTWHIHKQLLGVSCWSELFKWTSGVKFWSTGTVGVNCWGTAEANCWGANCWDTAGANCWGTVEVNC